jgi:hypothetical protein
VPAKQFAEVRYEDLVADPVGQLQRIYSELELGDFAETRPQIEAFLARNAGYETNRYQLTPGQRAEVGQRWGDVIRRYGYTEPRVD